MKKFLEKFFKREKPLIVCIHGFGKRRDEEYKNFKEYFSDYEIIIPKLFDQTDSKDRNWFDWVNRAEEAVKANKDRKIILVGYSMGGVIASHVASRNDNVIKLILLEPAFKYLTLTTAKDTIKDVIKPEKEFTEYPDMTSDMIKVFMAVVNNCKASIKNVKCPVLFFHCLKDSLIPWSVSEDVYNSIENPNKKLIIFGDGQHRVMDGENKELLFEIIEREINRN